MTDNEHYCPACRPEAFPDHRPDDPRYATVHNGGHNRPWQGLPLFRWRPYLDGALIKGVHSALVDGREGIIWFYHRNPETHLCPNHPFNDANHACERVAFGAVDLRLAEGH